MKWFKNRMMFTNLGKFQTITEFPTISDNINIKDNYSLDISNKKKGSVNSLTFLVIEI